MSHEVVHFGRFLRAATSLALLALAACAGDTDLGSYYITVKMLGVFESPAAATGSFEPISQNYNITDIVLVEADDTETSILDASAEKEFVIIDRSQIIAKKAIAAANVDKAYNGFRVYFDSVVTGTSKLKSDHEITIDTTSVGYGSFTMPKGSDVTFTVRIKWKGTVIRDESAGTDTMEIPQFEMKASGL